MRNLTAIVVLVLLAPFALGGAEEQKLAVTFVTDVGGLGDRGSNDAAWEGVKRAANEFSCPIRAVTSKEPGDYAANLSAAAEGAKVVVSVGRAMADVVRFVAPKYTNVYFVQVEGEIDGLPNVVSYDFKAEEAGFLAGVVAALYTKTGFAGVVTPPDAVWREAYITGFTAGTKAAGRSAMKKVDTAFLAPDGAEDAAQSKLLADGLVGRGCDVISITADRAGMGVLGALKDKPTVKVIFQGADLDDAARGQVLASTTNRIGTAAFEGIKMAVDRTWESGYKTLGYREDGMTLSAMEYSKKLFSPADLATIEAAKGVLGRAETTVPTTATALENWTPPKLAGEAR